MTDTEVHSQSHKIAEHIELNLSLSVTVWHERQGGLWALRRVATIKLYFSIFTYKPLSYNSIAFKPFINKKIGRWGGKWWWGWKMLSVSSLTRWSTVQMYNISYSYLFIFLLIFLFLYIFLVSNQKNIKERIILKIRKK